MQEAAQQSVAASPAQPLQQEDEWHRVAQEQKQAGDHAKGMLEEAANAENHMQMGNGPLCVPHMTVLSFDTHAHELCGELA